MKTILAATLAAILAAGITATAANQGEPVYDQAAIKQLKKLNNAVGQSRLTGLRGDMNEGYDDLWNIIKDLCRATSDSPYCPGIFDHR